MMSEDAQSNVIPTPIGLGSIGSLGVPRFHFPYPSINFNLVQVKLERSGVKMNRL